MYRYKLDTSKMYYTYLHKNLNEKSNRSNVNIQRPTVSMVLENLTGFLDGNIINSLINYAKSKKYIE